MRTMKGSSSMQGAPRFRCLQQMSMQYTTDEHQRKGLRTSRHKRVVGAPQTVRFRRTNGEPDDAEEKIEHHERERKLEDLRVPPCCKMVSIPTKRVDSMNSTYAADG